MTWNGAAIWQERMGAPLIEGKGEGGLAAVCCLCFETLGGSLWSLRATALYILAYIRFGRTPADVWWLRGVWKKKNWLYKEGIGSSSSSGINKRTERERAWFESRERAWCLKRREGVAQSETTTTTEIGQFRYCPPSLFVRQIFVLTWGQQSVHSNPYAPCHSPIPSI